MAASAAGLVLAFAAPAAFADTPPNGATAGQAAATDQTTTNDSQADPGTPGDTGQASDQSPSAPPATDVVTGLDDSPSGTAETASSSSQGPASDGTGDASDADSSAPTATGQSASAGASAGQSGAANGNVSTRVGQGGNDGSVSQGNDASASASSSAGGNVPTSGTDPGSTASAGVTQGSPQNTNVDVRVDSPGNTGSVDQANTAGASAAATGNGDPDGAAPGGVADADATQTDPSNVNVIIRVGSPGDNGPVTQQNTASASAGSTLPDGTTDADTSTPDPDAADQAVETSGFAGTANDANLDQEIDQEQADADTPPAGSTPPADDPLPSGTTTGTATATQTGASNTNVSIRIGSPGVDGPVTQTSTATATGTSPELGTVTVSGGSNTNVSIVLPGAVTGPPAGSDPWTWNWVWNGDWTPAAGATADDVASTATADWNWTWQNEAPAAASTDEPVPPTANVWSWTWNWTAADGSVSSLVWQRPCACSWSWTWTWDWSTATPVSTSTAPAAPSEPGAPAPDETYDTGPVVQTNDVSASAEAQAQMTVGRPPVEQTQDGGDQDASAAQSFVATQDAIATANAEQVDPLNLIVAWGAATDGFVQLNQVSARSKALVTLEATQTIEQTQSGAADSEQSALADQELASAQAAVADASAAQAAPENVVVVWAPQPNSARIGTVAQTNAGSAVADAEITFAAAQAIQQIQTAAAADQEAGAVQLLVNAQEAAASVAVQQLRIANRYDATAQQTSRATAPPLTQLNLADAIAGSFDDLVVAQRIVQVQDGEEEAQSSLALQEGDTVQSAIASSGASQSDLLNREFWIGPTPAPDDGTAGSPPADETDVALTGATGGAPPSEISTLEPAPAPFTGFFPRGTGRDASRAPKASFSPRTGTSATTQLDQTITISTTTTSSNKLGFSVLAARAGSASNAAVGAPRETGGRRGTEKPTRPFDYFDSLVGSGPGGSAPASGGGPVGTTSSPYTLAAPAHFGSQSPASDLGRPAAFFDPFERPG